MLLAILITRKDTDKMKTSTVNVNRDIITDKVGEVLKGQEAVINKSFLNNFLRTCTKYSDFSKQYI